MIGLYFHLLISMLVNNSTVFSSYGENPKAHRENEKLGTQFCAYYALPSWYRSALKIFGIASKIFQCNGVPHTHCITPYSLHPIYPIVSRMKFRDKLNKMKVENLEANMTSPKYGEYSPTFLERP